jgi:hypothetical protein
VLELREDLAVLQTVSSIYSISLSIAGQISATRTHGCIGAPKATKAHAVAIAM